MGQGVCLVKAVRGAALKTPGGVLGLSVVCGGAGGPLYRHPSGKRCLRCGARSRPGRRVSVVCV